MSFVGTDFQFRLLVENFFGHAYTAITLSSNPQFKNDEFLPKFWKILGTG